MKNSFVSCLSCDAKSSWRSVSGSCPTCCFANKSSSGLEAAGHKRQEDMFSSLIFTLFEDKTNAKETTKTLLPIQKWSDPKADGTTKCSLCGIMCNSSRQETSSLLLLKPALVRREADVRRLQHLHQQLRLHFRENHGQ